MEAVRLFFTGNISKGQHQKSTFSIGGQEKRQMHSLFRGKPELGRSQSPHFRVKLMPITNSVLGIGQCQNLPSVAS
jgi:hypothetical protein